MPGPLITLPISALVAGLGIWALVVTIQQWRGRRPRRPISAWMRSNKALDTEARLAYDRGGLAVGFGVLFFALFIADTGIGGPHSWQGRSDSTALGAIAGISVLGAVLSGALFLSIKYFNRPKFLVPPPLRSEPGVIAGRRKRRESLRSPL